MRRAPASARDSVAKEDFPSIEFDAVVFRDGATFVAYAPRLDLSSCGDSAAEARENLREAVRLFVEETTRMGTIAQMLGEAGYRRRRRSGWVAPAFVATEHMDATMET